MSYYYNINSQSANVSNSFVQNQLTIGSSFTGSIFCSATGLSFTNNLVPTSTELNLGTLEQPWRSIYISTGSIFIGPSGALQNNGSDLISSLVGFAAPYFQVGGINPGEGVLLYEQNNILWFQNQSGATGPVSIFNVASNNINNTFFTGGNLGIGTETPSYVLDVAGTIHATSFTGTNAYFSNLTATTYTGTNVYITNVVSTGGNFDYLTTNSITIGTSYTGSIFCSATGLSFNTSLVPISDNLNLGTLQQPWRSIYVNTGTVFIGPTGALQINGNGLMSSFGGFAAPYFQVGSINPGQGVLLYEQNNILWFQNQSGATGPISIFNVASNSLNNTFFTGGNLGIGTSTPNYPLDVAGTIQATTFTGTNAYFSNLTATTYTGTNVYITNVVSTGGNFDSITTKNFTGTDATIVNTHVSNLLKVGSSNIGKIYFSTGSTTGCFLEGIRNATGSSNLVYNSTTKEITYTTPNYLYAYYTGTQTTSATSFTGVLFNRTPLLDGFTHTTNTALFTFTADTNGIYQISYSLEVHSNNNAAETLTAYLDLDGTPISGSARSVLITGNTTNETTLTHTVLSNISSGSHTIQVLMQSSNATRITIQNPNNVIAPGLAGSAASLTIHRII